MCVCVGGGGGGGWSEGAFAIYLNNLQGYCTLRFRGFRQQCLVYIVFWADYRRKI